MNITELALGGGAEVAKKLLSPAATPAGKASLLGPQLTPESMEGGGDALGNFADLLKKAVGHVNQLEEKSGQLIERYAAGEDVQLHDVMISMEKAGTAMDMTMQVRNKLLTAYQELSRMQV